MVQGGELGLFCPVPGAPLRWVQCRQRGQHTRDVYISGPTLSWPPFPSLQGSQGAHWLIHGRVDQGDGESLP